MPSNFPTGPGGSPSKGPVTEAKPLMKDVLAAKPDDLQWFVPGRIEVLGKHTDYAGGRSLLAAIKNGLTFTAHRLDEPVIRVRSDQAEGVAEFHLDKDIEVQPGHWSNYPATVVSRLRANFPGMLPGADILIESTLPLASGMSSSSAMIVGMARCLIDMGALNQTMPFRREIDGPETLAGYLACIENGMSYGELTGRGGVGTFGGSEDHTAMLCSSSKENLVQYAFCPVRRERVVDFPAEYSFVVAVSGVLAEKTGAAREAYNRASLSTRQIVQLWNEDTGRSDTYLADAVRSSEDAPARLRALVAGHAYLSGRLDQFIVESEELVPAGGTALIDGDLQLFGEICDRSQRLSETGLQNQVPQTVFLQRSARALGAVAASAFGAGFGGSVWAMVPTCDTERFADEWLEEYLRKFPYLRGQASTIVTRPFGKARRLKATHNVPIADK